MTNRVCVRILASAICLVSIASASVWQRTYGGTNEDKGTSAQQTMDGGYIATGYTASYGKGGKDVYLIKTNGRGDTLWTRTFGGDTDDVAYSVEQTNDSGYIVAGYTKSFGAGGQDFYLIKTNGRGDTLWTRTFGGDSDDVAYSVEQTKDGGYIVAGYTKSFGGVSRVYLIRTGASGETLWTRTYGDTIGSQGYSVQQTLDSGFVVAGTTEMKHGQPFYLLKTNATGETLWTRTHYAPHEAVGYCVQQTQDSGYVVAGCDFDLMGGNLAILLKYDHAGDTVWTRSFFGLSIEFAWVRQTPDLGYIVADWTYTYGSSFDATLMRFSSSGDSMWSRTYGGNGMDVACSIEPTSDGGYVMAGYTQSFGAGGYDVYLVKTDSLGNAGVEGPLNPRSAVRPRLLVRPNPFASIARVAGHETELFTVSDATGRQVAICKGDQVGAGLQPGVYFLSPVGSKPGKTVTIIKAAF
jgi:hypothetical protein